MQVVSRAEAALHAERAADGLSELVYKMTLPSSTHALSVSTATYRQQQGSGGGRELNHLHLVLIKFFFLRWKDLGLVKKHYRSNAAAVNNSSTVMVGTRSFLVGWSVNQWLKPKLADRERWSRNERHTTKYPEFFSHTKKTATIIKDKHQAWEINPNEKCDSTEMQWLSFFPHSEKQKKASNMLWHAQFFHCYTCTHSQRCRECDLCVSELHCRVHSMKIKTKTSRTDVAEGLPKSIQ